MTATGRLGGATLAAGLNRWGGSTSTFRIFFCRKMKEFFITCIMRICVEPCDTSNTAGTMSEGLNELKTHLRRLLLLPISAVGESPFPRHNGETGCCILQKTRQSHEQTFKATRDSRGISEILNPKQRSCRLRMYCIFKWTAMTVYLGSICMHALILACWARFSQYTSIMFITSPLCSWIFSSSLSQAQNKYKAQNIRKVS